MTQSGGRCGPPRLRTPSSNMAIFTANAHKWRGCVHRRIIYIKRASALLLFTTETRFESLPDAEDVRLLPCRHSLSTRLKLQNSFVDSKHRGRGACCSTANLYSRCGQPSVRAILPSAGKTYVCNSLHIILMSAPVGHVTRHRPADAFVVRWCRKTATETSHGWVMLRFSPSHSTSRNSRCRPSNSTPWAPTRFVVVLQARHLFL